MGLPGSLSVLCVRRAGLLSSTMAIRQIDFGLCSEILIDLSPRSLCCPCRLVLNKATLSEVCKAGELPGFSVSKNARRWGHVHMPKAGGAGGRYVYKLSPARVESRIPKDTKIDTIPQTRYETPVNNSFITIAAAISSDYRNIGLPTPNKGQISTSRERYWFKAPKFTALPLLHSIWQYFVPLVECASCVTCRCDLPSFKSTSSHTTNP